MAVSAFYVNISLLCVHLFWASVSVHEPTSSSRRQRLKKKCLGEKSKFEEILLGDFIFCALQKGGYYSVFVEGPPFKPAKGNAGGVGQRSSG